MVNCFLTTERIAMYPIYCIMFTFSLNDDVRDLLFETAYLMLKNGAKNKRVRSDFCEGVIKTNFNHIALYGTSGIQFQARLETEEGELEVSYMVRPQDLHYLERDDAEYGAWLSPDEMIEQPDNLEERMRSNPIRRVAKKHLEN